MLTQNLERSLINATDAYLPWDDTYGYEKFPEYPASGWSKCQLDTADKQFGTRIKGAAPGQYASAECDSSTSDNCFSVNFNRRAREPSGFRNRFAFGSELNPPLRTFVVNR